jgi:hypothetical protein
MWSCRPALQSKKSTLSIGRADGFGPAPGKGSSLVYSCCCSSLWNIKIEFIPTNFGTDADPDLVDSVGFQTFGSSVNSFHPERPIVSSSVIQLLISSFYIDYDSIF